MPKLICEPRDEAGTLLLKVNVPTELSGELDEDAIAKYYYRVTAKPPFLPDGTAAASTEDPGYNPNDDPNNPKVNMAVMYAYFAQQNLRFRPKNW